MHQGRVAVGTGLRILLVEDNRLNQELIGDLLSLAGHRVDIVEDGDGLRARLTGDGDAPDVILLDVLLPGADGVSLLRELRATRVGAVPIVAVTAQALGTDLQRFAAAGFDAVITKPIDTRTFVAEVEKYAGGTARHH